MKYEITEAENLDVFCGLTFYTENAGEIKMPVFITDSVRDAQGRALSIGKNGECNDGWVYGINVKNAKFRFITNKLSILLDGEITINEIVHVKRNEDGQLEKLDRKKI
jgi:outer membrane protein W